MKNNVGKILWQDLTVDDAENVRDFYQAVVGWESDAVDMQGYHDYSMKAPEGDDAVAGICHSRGGNADLPSQWLLYFGVANLDTSLQQVLALGGKQLSAIKSYGGKDRYVAIQDPAGAVCALFEQNE